MNMKIDILSSSLSLSIHVFFFLLNLLLVPALYSTDQNQRIRFRIKLNQLTWLRTAGNFIPNGLTVENQMHMLMLISLSSIRQQMQREKISDIATISILFLALFRNDEKCHCKLC